MKPKIKVCGIQTLDEVNLINLFPIDFVGFLFAPSKRRISFDQFIYLKKHLRSDIQTVGVFVDEPIDSINALVNRSGLDIAQLHGDETENDCRNVIIPTWKSISISTLESFNQIHQFNSSQGFLLDSPSQKYKGGTGLSFNWDLVNQVKLRNYFIILAGGLNFSNVALGIKKVSPQVVDVSSGVEKNGSKNKELLEKFIRSVKNHEI